MHLIKIPMVLIKKIKVEKISKGYRLKKTTHELIDKMQIILKVDQDTIVTKACRMYYRELKNNNR